MTAETAKPERPTRRPTRALIVIAAVSFGAIGAVWTTGPIPQDQAYHAFADCRQMLGVPNASDVLSNAPFLIAAALGFWALFRAGRQSCEFAYERLGWAILFAGVALTGVGSAWYHIAPDDPSLVLDRLPMTIVFGAFAALMLGERVSPLLGRWALVPLVLLGMGSVLWWRASGDLRLYAIVHYVPAVSIVMMLLMLPARYTRARDIWLLAAFYALAKVCEAADRPIFELTDAVSGHTLKHVAAAVGTAFLARHVTLRRPLGSTRAASPAAAAPV